MGGVTKVCPPPPPWGVLGQSKTTCYSPGCFHFAVIAEKLPPLVPSPPRGREVRGAPGAGVVLRITTEEQPPHSIIGVWVVLVDMLG